MNGYVNFYSGMETEGGNVHVFFEKDIRLDNMRNMQNGDTLTIYSKDGNCVLWSGILDICVISHETTIHYEGIDYKLPVDVYGQRGEDPTVWNRYFETGHPATLKQIPRPPHNEQNQED